MSAKDWKRTKRIIAGRLESWAEFRKQPDYPEGAVSSWYRRVHKLRPDKDDAVLEVAASGGNTSPQEVWAIRRQAELHEAAIIEDTLRRMTQPHQKLVLHRFIGGKEWTDVADAIHVSETEVYRMWDRVAAIFAHSLRIVKDGE